MHWTIRDARLPDDYPALAALVSETRFTPVAAAELADEDAQMPPGSLLRYRVVDGADDSVIGALKVSRFPNTRVGKLYVSVITAVDARGQGIGAALYRELERIAVAAGATLLVGSVRDDDAGSRAWAERRGFAVRRHWYESALDLARFDAARFAGVVAAVEHGGIHFLTAADVPGPETERKLYELCRRTFPDIPGYDAAAFMSPDAFHAFVFEGAGKRPDLVIIAADGARFAGLTTLQLFDDHAYTPHTSVDPDYRGRDIALALKLVSIAAARRLGVNQLRTGNDSLNAPMLAINRKLGYVPVAGEYDMFREMAPSV